MVTNPANSKHNVSFFGLLNKGIVDPDQELTFQHLTLTQALIAS